MQRRSGALKTVSAVLFVAVLGLVASTARAGSLTGTVTDGDASPLPGIEVSAYADNGSGWQLIGFTETSLDGDYVIDGLADGVYRVLFRDWSQTFAFEYHPDAPTIDMGQDVWLFGSQVVNAELEPGGRITGLMTDASGAPLEYPMVFVYADGDEPDLLFVGSVDEPTGVYEVGGLPTGNYLMMYSGRRGLESFVGYFDGVVRITEATPIPVVAGVVTAGIDARLGPPPGGFPGGIEGRLTGPDGVPVPGIEVSLYESTGPGQWVLSEFQSSASDGSFVFNGLRAGAYTLGFRDWNQVFAFGYWGGHSRLSDALAIDVTDFTVPADETLEIGGRISGALTDPAGSPLANAMVFVHTFEDDPQVLFISNPDPATGAYELGGLPTGDYIVQFTGYQGLDSFNEYYDGVPTIDLADPVAVVIGDTTTGIDGELGIPPGGVISGRITDPYLRSFDFARVSAYQWDGDDWVLAGQTETTYYESEYELPLPPGDYRLLFEGGSFLQFDLPAWEFFDDVGSIDNATPVTVVLDQRIDGLDVAVGNLSTGSISGTVTDAATGAPLSGIEVWVADRKGRVLTDQIAVTAGDGSYTVDGLWPEGYRVEFYDPDYGYGTSLIPSVLVARDPVVGIDAALDLVPAGSLPGSVTGTVVDEDGNPIFNIRVVADDPVGSGFAVSTTDSQGFFRLRDLADGTYEVRFSSPDGFWVPEIFDDVTDPSAAQPVVVSASSTTAGVDAELAAAGVITGKITNRFGGDFQIATAIAYRFDGSAWRPVEDTSIVYESEYRMEGVPVGIYRVELLGRSFSGSPLREFFDDVPTVDLATDVVVAAGEVTSGISGSLGQGPPGAIAGTVTDGAGAPLTGIEVIVYDEDFEPEATVSTLSDGTYEVGDLYRGRYSVEFRDPAGIYPGEAYDDVANIGLATPITVGDSTVFGIDAVLDGAGSGPGGGGIRGAVVDATTGQPIEGIRVRCVDELFGFVPECTAHTTADGSYQLAGFLPGGSYFVKFSAPNGGWADEWYDDVIQIQAATPVSVVEGAWSDGVDAALEPAGAISGTVTNAGGGAFSLLTVTAFRWDGSGWSPYKTDLRAYETDYEIGGLPGGSYRVKFRGGAIFNPSFGIEEYFDDAATLAEATDVVVTVGVTTAGIDAVLESSGPGAIAGVVTDDAGVGLAGIDVRVWDDGFELEKQATTGADGSYEIDGLFSGRYYVDFVDPAGVHPAEAYDNVASIDVGTPIFVGTGLVNGIDAVLDGFGPGPGGGGIRGVVSDAVSGAPIEGVRVSCSDASFGFIDGCSTTTAADGSYQLGGFLPEGSVVVRFRAADGFHATEWYDDAPTAQQATPIPVVRSIWSDGIDAALEPAGGISGTVTNEGGGAFSRTSIIAFRWAGSGWVEQARTDAFYDTDYELLGLPEGTYRVKFRGGSIFNPTFGVEEFYDDVLTLDLATDVAVTVGSVTPGIGAVLGNLEGGESAIANPSFDDDLDGWSTESTDGSSVHHGGVDVAGSALSGAAEVVSAGGTGTANLAQCVAVDGGSGLRFGAWSRVSGGGAGSPAASVRVEFFADAECSGEAMSAATAVPVGGAHDWLTIAGVASAPPGAVAVRLDLVLRSSGGTAFNAHWDEVEIGVDGGIIMADGFESGTAGSWVEGAH
jgi:hypothetical protein